MQRQNHGFQSDRFGIGLEKDDVVPTQNRVRGIALKILQIYR